MKPMVDGKTIQVLYGCKPGKHMKAIIEECLNFQILNLGASSQEIEAFMMEHKDEFLKKYA